MLAESIRQLVVRTEPRESTAGIVVTAAALVVMPLLAWAKRRLGKQLNNAVLVAEATETALCALLSGAALMGLLLNSEFGWWWADPAGGIVIAIIAISEGFKTWKGHESRGCSE